MIVLGGLVGVMLGVLLGATMHAVGSVPMFGPASAIFTAIVTTGLLGVSTHVVAPIIFLLAAGLGVLAATVFVYAAAAVSLIGLVAAGGAGTALTPPLTELFTRGILIGLSASVNFVLMSTVPALAPFAAPVGTIVLLAVIPPIAANRAVYQGLLGLFGWILPLNYIMLPLGILLFIVNAPFALAAGGIGAFRFDFGTFTIETTGGAIVGFLFSLGPATSAGFNLGNFTFIRPGVAGGAFGGTTLSSHEVGHTVTNAAFGGFFGLINAVDENILPRRGPAAYGELIPESHSAERGFQSLPMW